MSAVQGLVQGLVGIASLIYHPLDYLLMNFGIDTDTISVSLGIGQVEFFTLTLTELLQIIVSVVVWYVFVRFIYWLIKSIIGLFTRYLR